MESASTLQNNELVDDTEVIHSGTVEIEENETNPKDASTTGSSTDPNQDNGAPARGVMLQL